MKHFIAPIIKVAAGAVAAVLIAVSVSGGVPTTAVAAATINLTASVQTTFPTSMTFTVHAQSASKITQLRLHYKVDRQNVADVTSESWAVFTPATTVDTQWVWDMRKSSLPPGAQVEYWWTALDAAGDTGQTAPVTVSFDDNHHKWQTITGGQITLEWYDGSQSFANSLLSAGEQGIQRIESNTGVIPQGNVTIFIYASAQDLQSAQIFAQQWEGGTYFDTYNLIAIGVAPDQLSYGEAAVPHELTHWIIHQASFNSYGAGLPTWLDEGLATYGEGALANPQYKAALNYAIQNNALISLRTLSSPFSPIAQQAYISYGESNSVVTFMINTFGKDKIHQLLQVFQHGAGYDEALETVYGFNQDGLYALWRQSLGLGSSTMVAEPDLVLAAG